MKLYRSISLVLVTVLTIALVHQAAHTMWGDDYLSFFKGIIKNPLQVGAITPCSTFVATEITKHIARNEHTEQSQPLYVLEAGGGSGIFTTKLEQMLDAQKVPYHLDVIEINPEYAQLLRERFAHNPSIAVHACDIVSWKPAYQYDCIISSLPFTNIPYETVEQILHTYAEIIKPQGMLSYIEYRWLADIKGLLLSAEQKKEYQKKRSLIAAFKEQFSRESVTVWANIPPVHVHHLQITHS
jgi:phospholipid N-methyltransferase